MPGNKPPEQFTIDAMRKDAASGMNLNKIAEKHAVGWITAKKYAGDAVVKTNGAKPAGGESSGQPRPNRMALADSMRFWWSCARNVIN